MAEPPTDEEHVAQVRRFEEDGEEAVRSNVALERYGPKHLRRAENWLRQKDQARLAEDSRRSEASRAEQIRIARSAKNAAWIAATAATIAAICAAAAIVMSLRP